MNALVSFVTKIPTVFCDVLDAEQMAERLAEEMNLDEFPVGKLIFEEAMAKRGTVKILEFLQGSHGKIFLAIGVK